MWTNNHFYSPFNRTSQQNTQVHPNVMSYEWNVINASYYNDYSLNGTYQTPKHNMPVIKQEPVDETSMEIQVDPILPAVSPRSAMSPNCLEKNKDKAPSIHARTCETCGKVLSSLSSLYVHLKTHSTNKPYQCQDCNASFTRKYYLEVHQRSHTGERPFHCEVCKKNFSQKSSLNTHKRKHTGEKPYQCDHCDKSFSAQSYLSSHQWSHYKRDDSGILQCPSCNENFSSRNRLVQHIRIHSGSLEYVCQVCTKRFSKESYLIRHIKVAHGKSVNKTTK